MKPICAKLQILKSDILNMTWVNTVICSFKRWSVWWNCAKNCKYWKKKKMLNINWGNIM